jgi:hypothetical protein
LAGIDERDDDLGFCSIFGDCWRLSPSDWSSEEVRRDELTFVCASCFGEQDVTDERKNVSAVCLICRDRWIIIWFAGGDPELSVLAELFRLLPSRGISY